MGVNDCIQLWRLHGVSVGVVNYPIFYVGHDVSPLLLAVMLVATAGCLLVASCHEVLH